MRGTPSSELDENAYFSDNCRLIHGKSAAIGDDGDSGEPLGNNVPGDSSVSSESPNNEASIGDDSGQKEGHGDEKGHNVVPDPMS